MNISKFLPQTAVYWAAPVSDGYGGYTYDNPVEVAIRWSDKQEVFSRSIAGAADNAVAQEISKAVVLSETDFELEGRLLLGELLDLSSDQDPDINDALTIKGYAKIPDKSASQFLRKAWLV